MTWYVLNKSGMRTPATFKRNNAGTTFLETAFAVGLLSVFIAILLTVGSNLLGLLRSSQANIAANQVLHERSELIHSVNWLQLTDASFLSTEFMSFDAESIGGLAKPVETITVSAYPPKTGMVTQVVRKNGAATVVTSNPLLKNERMVRVDFSVEWQGAPKNRARSRMTSCLVSRAGSNKQ